MSFDVRHKDEDDFKFFIEVALHNPSLYPEVLDRARTFGQVASLGQLDTSLIFFLRIDPTKVSNGDLVAEIHNELAYIGGTRETIPPHPINFLSQEEMVRKLYQKGVRNVYENSCEAAE